MKIQLHELATPDGILFSPPCWRTRLSLEWRGLEFDSVPTSYTEIREVAQGEFNTVPILSNEAITMNDSWEINKYLDITYAARGKIFRTPAEEAQALLVQQMMMVPSLLRVALMDLFSRIAAKDKGYFRNSREKRFNMPLEEAVLPPEEGMERIIDKFQALEDYLGQREYLGGDSPNYADITFLSHLQLPIQISNLPLLVKMPATQEWVHRCTKKFPSLNLWVKDV